MKAPKKIQLDEIDIRILDEIQQNSRISNNELAKRINLSQPATHSRLKRLKEGGVILNYSAQLDLTKVGFELICFFQTRLQGHSEAAIVEFENQIRTFPEVLECHYLTGEFDHLLKAIFRDRSQLEYFLRNKLSTIPGIAQIITSLVLSEIKSTQVVPIPEPN